MPRNTFEINLVKSFNKYFRDNKIRAFSYRLKQSKYVNQYIDLLVDSKDPKYYCAIECKSIKTNKIYFNSHFNGDQIERENQFITLTGRNGYLAVEFRRGIGKPRESYLLPWILVYERYVLFKETGLKKYNGFNYQECQTLGIKLKREKGFYVISLS